MALPEEPAKKEEDVHEEEMPTLQEIRPREEHLTTHKETLEEARLMFKSSNPGRECTAMRMSGNRLEASVGSLAAQRKRNTKMPRSLVHAAQVDVPTIRLGALFV